MSRRIIMILLALMIAMPVCSASARAAVTCTVNYYYTSAENPEGIPKATTGVRSGSLWKITPAKLSRSVYTKTSGSKTVTYTFKGWYTNINCLGKSYTPGAETKELMPSETGTGYRLNLYGKWVCSEKDEKAAANTQLKNTRPTTAPLRAAQPAIAEGAATKKEGADAEQEGVAGTELSSISAYTFPQVGAARSLEAKSMTGSGLQFSSSNPAVVSVDGTGMMKANGAGTAVITIRLAEGADAGTTVSTEDSAKSVTVHVPAFRSREAALAPWKHLLIDTFFHINGRKYSFSKPGKYWKDSKGNWSGKTGGNGKTQSCITLPTVSLKRTGIISANSGSIWLSSNMSSKPNRTVKRLKKTSSKLTITYPHRSLKKLAKEGGVRYGDILCRSGHTFVYMGKDAKGNPLAYDGGTLRHIGNGTKVVWGHSGKSSAKIRKQIKASDAQGEKWRKGILTDASFPGHKASGRNLHHAIHIVCSINTFSVKTSCVNGTISLGNNYMAGQTVTVRYEPSPGRTLKSVLVDGKNADVKQYAAAYSFPSIGADHTISVEYQ